MTDFNADIIWEPGTRFVRFGSLAQLNDIEYNLTVVDQPTGEPRGVNLREPEFRFLRNFDIHRPLTEYSDEEAGLLLTLARTNFGTFLREMATTESLAFVPTPRRNFTLVESYEQGYRLQVIDGDEFLLDETGARILGLVDGKRTLGEILSLVRQTVEASSDDLAAFEEAAQSRGKTVDRLLVDEGLNFVNAIVTAAAASMEPAVSAA